MTENERQKIEWLSRYNTLQLRIDRLENELEKIQTRLEGVGAQVITGMPRGNRKRDAEKLILKADEIERILTVEIMSEMEERQLMFNAINSIVDPKLQVLLEYRYIDGYRFEKICEKMNYSWQWVHKLHEKALKKIILPKRSD